MAPARWALLLLAGCVMLAAAAAQPGADGPRRPGPRARRQSPEGANSDAAPWSGDNAPPGPPRGGSRPGRPGENRSPGGSGGDGRNAVGGPGSGSGRGAPAAVMGTGAAVGAGAGAAAGAGEGARGSQDASPSYDSSATPAPSSDAGAGPAAAAAGSIATSPPAPAPAVPPATLTPTQTQQQQSPAPAVPAPAPTASAPAPAPTPALAPAPASTPVVAPAHAPASPAPAPVVAPMQPNETRGTPTRDAVIVARLRLQGPQVVPFTAQKHNAVITGVANTLGDGVLASDISLAVLQDDSHAGTEALAATGRRLRQLAVVQGVALALNVTTSSAAVLQQRARLQAAVGPPYELASNIGSQGLYTTSLVLSDARITLLPLAKPAEAPAAPLAVAAASQASQTMAIPASIGGVPTWVVGTLGALAAVLLVTLACLCGYLSVRWCRKRRAERLQADYVSKYFEDVSQPYKTPVAGARGRANAFAVTAGGARTASPNPVPTLANAWSRRVFPSTAADDAGAAPIANPIGNPSTDPRRAHAPAVKGILRSSSSLSRALAASSSAAAAAGAAAGTRPNPNPASATTANPAFRLKAVPAGGDTGVRPAQRFVLPGTEPRRTADVPVRPARRLQMARPDRAVLQTEPPPPLGASAALEAAEATAGRP